MCDGSTRARSVLCVADGAFRGGREVGETPRCERDISEMTTFQQRFRERPTRWTRVASRGVVSVRVVRAFSFAFSRQSRAVQIRETLPKVCVWWCEGEPRAHCVDALFEMCKIIIAIDPVHRRSLTMKRRRTGGGSGGRRWTPTPRRRARGNRTREGWYQSASAPKGRRRRFERIWPQRRR